MFQAVDSTMYCSTTYPAKKKYSLAKKARVSTSSAAATRNETPQNLAVPMVVSAPTASLPHRGRERGPARRAGRVRVYPTSSARRIASITPLALLRTSWFQNLITRQPCFSNQAVRRASAALSACWPPSTSITNPCSVQAKSTTKSPIGCCRRNLYLDNRRSRRADHIHRSASVEDCLHWRALWFGID